MILIDENGTIYLYQGDSGEVVVTGLDSDKNYTVYFAIQDEKRHPMGMELQVPSGGSDTVCFNLTSDFTDLLTVPANKQFKIYYYGIKACENDSENEDTLFVSDGIYGDQNMIIVYPRKVIGA